MLKFFNDFSEESLQSFENFVLSPYFNKSKAVVALFYHLKSKHPFAQKEDISYEILARVIDQQNGFSKERYYKIITRFNIIFDRFLAYEEIRNDEVGNGLKLLDALWKIDWESKFMKTYDRVKKLNGQKARDNHFYYHEIALLEYAYKKSYTNRKEPFHLLLNEINTNTDLMYATHKMIYYFEMMVQETFHSKKFFKPTFMKQVFVYIENNEKFISHADPYLYIHYLVARIIETMDQKYLSKYSKYFRHVEKLNNKYYLRVYLMRKDYFLRYGAHIKKNKFFEEELLDFYRWLFKNDFFELVFGNRIVLYTAYLVMIQLFLNNGDLDYSRKLIERSKPLLHPDFSNDTYNYAKAILCFYENDLDSCFLYLNKITIQRPEFYYYKKLLIARIFFVQKKFAALDSLLQNVFKKFLNEKKITDNIRKNFISEASFLKKMSALAFGRSPNHLIKFKMLSREAPNVLQAHIAPWYVKTIRDFEF